MSVSCLKNTRTFLKQSTAAPRFDFVFDGGSNDLWNQNLSNCAADFDTTHVCTDPNAAGQNRRITKTVDGACNFAQNFSPSIDLSGTHGKLEFWLPPLSLADGVYPGNTPRMLSIGMFLYDNSAGVKSSVFYSPNLDMDEGYKSVPIILDEWPAGIDLTDIQRILFQIGWATGTGDSITLDRMRFWTKPAKASIIIRFDDSSAIQNSYCNTAKDNGFFCNVLTIPDVIDNGGLTLAQMRALKADGHKFCNHTNNITDSEQGTPVGYRWQNATKAALSSYADVLAGVNSGRDALRSMGFPEHAEVMGIPGGYHNPNVSDRLITDRHCRAVWAAGSGQWGSSAGAGGTTSPNITPFGQHDWAIRTGYQMDSQASITVQGVIDNLIAKGGMATFYGHALLVDWPTTAAYIKTKVDAGLLQVLTLDDLVMPAGGGLDSQQTLVP